MEITITLQPNDRAAWRNWLEAHHANHIEIWVLLNNSNLTYLESVEVALCFGWIDGIKKRFDEQFLAQRFTPRRKNSHWTELNKERARKLIAQGHMHEAGYATLPDLTLEPLQLADDIERALQADPVVWQNFLGFSDIYKRIRMAYIEEARKDIPTFETRLKRFLEFTKLNKQFGGTR